MVTVVVSGDLKPTQGIYEFTFFSSDIFLPSSSLCVSYVFIVLCMTLFSLDGCDLLWNDV